MSKVITIHQPDFLPWLGFFQRWNDSDEFIILDNVQFIKRGWHHRDQIKTPQGKQWLTVPVQKKGNYTQQIRNVLIDNQSNWKKKHVGNIRQNYSRAPNFDTLMPQLIEIYHKPHSKLIDFNLDLLQLCALNLGIDKPYRLASDYVVDGKKTTRLVNLVIAAGGSIYLTGTGSKNYLDEKAFAGKNIELCWQSYCPTIYPQFYGDFEPMLSVLDFLLMVSNPESEFQKLN